MNPPRLAILPVLEKVKNAYILWYGYSQTIQKIHRYSLGVKIDKLFVEIMEAITIAGFLSKDEKLPWVRSAIRKADTLKVMLMILWEVGSIENKKYVELSLKIDNFGKDLGGWNGQTAKYLQEKQNLAK